MGQSGAGRGAPQLCSALCMYSTGGLKLGELVGAVYIAGCHCAEGSNCCCSRLLNHPRPPTPTGPHPRCRSCLRVSSHWGLCDCDHPLPLHGGIKPGLQT